MRKIAPVFGAFLRAANGPRGSAVPLSQPARHSRVAACAVAPGRKMRICGVYTDIDIHWGANVGQPFEADGDGLVDPRFGCRANTLVLERRGQHVGRLAGRDAHARSAVRLESPTYVKHCPCIELRAEIAPRRGLDCGCRLGRDFLQRHTGAGTGQASLLTRGGKPGDLR